MPSDPYVWIVLIIVGGLIAALALWKGGVFKVGKDEKGFSLEVEGQKEHTEKGGVSVAREARLTDVEAGDIAGEKGPIGEASSGQPVEVAHGAKIERSKVGDIVGRKYEGGSSGDKS